MNSKKDYIDSIVGAERRHVTHKVEYRADDNGSIIEGVASSVNKRYSLGWMEEEVMPGAFDDVLKDDVRALFNHDPNLPLARSVDGRGTLELSIDNEGGLKYSYKTPNRTYARDLEDAIKSGDVSQSSFAFSIESETWIERDGDIPLRQINKVGKLYDVSVVTYPANPDTSVAKRSFEGIKPDHKVDVDKYLSLKSKELKLKLKS